jgi:hypothetical protein
LHPPTPFIHSAQIHRTPVRSNSKKACGQPFFPSFRIENLGKKVGRKFEIKVIFIILGELFTSRQTEFALKSCAKLNFKGHSNNRRRIFARPCKGSPFCPVFLAKQKNRSPVGRDRGTLI